MAQQARRYLDLAHQLLEPQPCRLIAIGGLSGSGKSTLAAAWRRNSGGAPARACCAAMSPASWRSAQPPRPGCQPKPIPPRSPAGFMTPFRQRLASALAAGYTTIIDAVALAPDERQAFAEIARKAAVPFTGLWLEADAEAMAQRIRDRRGDASDATAAVLARQLRQDPGPIDWVRIDAGGGPEAVVWRRRGCASREA